MTSRRDVVELCLALVPFGEVGVIAGHSRLEKFHIVCLEIAPIIVKHLQATVDKPVASSCMGDTAYSLQ